MNIAADVLTRLAAGGSRLAIRQRDGREIDCQGLRREILLRASRFSSAGVKPGDAVILQCPPGIEMAACAVAILAVGGVLVLTEASTPAALYLRQAELVGVRYSVVDRRLRWIHAVPGLAYLLEKRWQLKLPPLLDDESVLCIVSPPWMPSGLEELPAVLDTAANADAVIVFTGGTTQAPKGVRLSHSALHAYLAAISSLIQDSEIDSFVADTPQQILYGLYLGVSVWVPGGREDKRARCILEYLCQRDVEMFFGPPSTWHRILDIVERESVSAPLKLRLIMLGGAPVSNALLQRLHRWLSESTTVRILYGLTEAGPVSSCVSHERLQWEGAGNLVGESLPGVTVALEEINADGTGALTVSGRSLFSGYVGQPPHEGALRTGDLARLVDVAGRTQIALMGRDKDMVVRRGVNIYPTLLEPMLCELRDASGEKIMRECGLVGVWDAKHDDERLVLFFTPVPGRETKLSEAVVASCVNTALGSHLAPDRICELDALPMTGRQQKLDKHSLRIAARRLLGLSAESSQSPIGRQS